jgi:hypothetical protein
MDDTGSGIRESRLASIVEPLLPQLLGTNGANTSTWPLAERGSRYTARPTTLGADLGANRVEPCRSLATGGEPCGQLGTCEPARSAVLTRKRPLVRTQYRPPASLLVRPELHGCDFTADVASN